MSIVGGQVVDDTGRLIENATVRLVGARATATRLTDRRGRFLYRKRAGRRVCVDSVRRPAITTAPMANAGLPARRCRSRSPPRNRLADMRVELFRGCVITGSVVDEGNEPVAGVRVIAFRRDFVEGEWRYTTSGNDVTDDRGAFRVFGLEPGEYIVSTPTTQANTAEGEVLTATLTDVDERVDGVSIGVLSGAAVFSARAATAARVRRGEIRR